MCVKTKRIMMTPTKIGNILLQTIEKELDGKANGQDQYLEGMGTSFHLI